MSKFFEGHIPCEKPSNNLYDGGTNNYNLLKALQQWTPENCEEQLVTPPLGESDLNTARQNTAIKKAALLAEQCRDAGWKVMVHAGSAGFKSQFKRADLSGARWAIVIGEKELEQGIVAVKPLRESENGNIENSENETPDTNKLGVP